MPANRSRTQQWRQCLQQIAQRNGAIEIAVANEYESEWKLPDLLWRVRLLQVGITDLLVEQPTTCGSPIVINPGCRLVALLSIGQNRWIFRTRNIGPTEHRLNDRRSVPALRLTLPESVERCQRRDYYRIDTAAINLPSVEVWPLLDPASVVLAERANEVEQHGVHERRDEMRNASATRDQPTPKSSRDPASVPWGRPTTPADWAGSDPSTDTDLTMPDVGPGFKATLMNIGGGGVGLLVDPNDAPVLSAHKVYWLRITLPGLPEPTGRSGAGEHADPARAGAATDQEPRSVICATGKYVHSHMESSQHTFAGMAFDFSHNPGHQKFVVDQICRYIAHQQRLQLQRQTVQDLRRSA